LQRLPREDIHFFQGDLKSLHEDQYTQLKGSIERHGFFSPVFLWEGRVLDGHQRLHVLDKEGWEVEDGIPVVSIVAEDEKDAAEKLLLLSSTYGKIDSQGLYEFTEAHEIRMDDFDLADLPGLDLDAFKAEFYDVDAEFPGLPDEDRQPFQQMTFTLHDDQAEEVTRALSQAKAVGGGFEESPNENSNGNALALICSDYVTRG